MPVTTIGSGAFLNCEGLTSVHIPASVTHILGVYLIESEACPFWSNEFCGGFFPTGFGAF